MLKAVYESDDLQLQTILSTIMTDPNIEELVEEFGENFGSFDSLWEKRKDDSGEWVLFTDVENWLRKTFARYGNERAKEERERIVEMTEGIKKEIAGLAALVQQIPDTGQVHIAGMKLGNILSFLSKLEEEN